MTTGHRIETYELLTKEPMPCRHMPLVALSLVLVRGTPESALARNCERGAFWQPRRGTLRDGGPGRHGRAPRRDASMRAAKTPGHAGSRRGLGSAQGWVASRGTAPREIVRGGRFGLGRRGFITCNA